MENNNNNLELDDYTVSVWERKTVIRTADVRVKASSQEEAEAMVRQAMNGYDDELMGDVYRELGNVSWKDDGESELDVWW